MSFSTSYREKCATILVISSVRLRLALIMTQVNFDTRLSRITHTKKNSVNKSQKHTPRAIYLSFTLPRWSISNRPSPCQSWKDAATDEKKNWSTFLKKCTVMQLCHFISNELETTHYCKTAKRQTHRITIPYVKPWQYKGGITLRFSLQKQFKSSAVGWFLTGLYGSG